MSELFLVIIVLSLTGVFSQNKFIDIIFCLKILTMAVFAQLWKNSHITAYEAYIGFILTYLLLGYLIRIKHPKNFIKNEDVDTL